MNDPLLEPPNAEPKTAETSLDVFTPAEAADLDNCKAEIASGLQMFLRVGRALTRVRELKLWRRDASSFQEWLHKEFEISLRHGQRMIIAAKIADDLERSARPGTLLVRAASEAQLRPLALLPPEHRRVAWDEAIRTAPQGRLTAKHVAIVVANILQQEESLDSGTPPGGAGCGPAETIAGPRYLLRDEKLMEATEQAIEDLHEVISLAMAAPDSVAVEELNASLANLQRYQEHRKRVQKLHEARLKDFVNLEHLQRVQEFRASRAAA